MFVFIRGKHDCKVVHGISDSKKIIIIYLNLVSLINFSEQNALVDANLSKAWYCYDGINWNVAKLTELVIALIEM